MNTAVEQLLKQEEKQLERDISDLQGRLDRIRKAQVILNHSKIVVATPHTSHKLSRAGRAKISAAAKRRWAKFHKENK